MKDNYDFSGGKHNTVVQTHREKIMSKLELSEIDQVSWVNFFEKKYKAPNDFMTYKRDEKPQTRKLF